MWKQSKVISSYYPEKSYTKYSFRSSGETVWNHILKYIYKQISRILSLIYIYAQISHLFVVMFLHEAAKQIPALL